jgi:hypothetical protein
MNLPNAHSRLLDPSMLRTLPRCGNGWHVDTERPPRRWNGCDICGRGPTEMRHAYAIANDLLHTRALACPSCVASLTTPLRRRWWRFGR